MLSIIATRLRILVETVLCHHHNRIVLPPLNNSSMVASFIWNMRSVVLGHKEIDQVLRCNINSHCLHNSRQCELRQFNGTVVTSTYDRLL